MKTIFPRGLCPKFEGWHGWLIKWSWNVFLTCIFKRPCNYKFEHLLLFFHFFKVHATVNFNFCWGLFQFFEKIIKMISSLVKVYLREHTTTNLNICCGFFFQHLTFRLQYSLLDMELENCKESRTARVHLREHAVKDLNIFAHFFIIQP